MTPMPPRLAEPANGLVALSREKYDALDARINFSTLKHMDKTPAHYRAALDLPREDTEAMRLGRITHVAALEPERFASEVAVWTGGRRAGKEWEAFKAANIDRELVNVAECDECLAIARSVRESPEAMRYLATGRAEVTLLWTDEPSGLDCKGRFDWLATEAGALVDLKTTKDASPRAFFRQAWEKHYHAQAAMYQDAVFALTGQRLPFVIIAVEKTAPYVVQVYTVPEHLLAAGRLAYRTWLRRLTQCLETGRWPVYAEGPMELEAPRWADMSGESADEND